VRLIVVAAGVAACVAAVIAAAEDAADGAVDTAECPLAYIVSTTDEAVEGVTDCVLGALRECGRDGVRSVEARVGDVAGCAD